MNSAVQYPVDAEFRQACTALLADPTLADWEKVARIAELATATLTGIYCLRAGCQEEAVVCAWHAHEAADLTCHDCGADVTRVLCPDCQGKAQAG